MGDLQRAQFAAHVLEIAFDRFEVVRIAAAQLDIIVFEQPPRGAAHFPFGAGIGAGPKDHPEPLLLGNAAKFRHVGLAGPDEFAGSGLVKVPEEISANGVQAHGFGHLQTMPPVFLGHARGMDLTATNLQSLAVEQKIVGTDGEGVGRFGGMGGGDGQAGEREEEGGKPKAENQKESEGGNAQ